jgi:hypothetical protein
VVGILRVAKAGWFSGVNNLNVIQFLPFVCLLSECRLQVYMLGDSGRYSTACMFTEAETRLLYEEQKKALESCDRYAMIL